MDQPPLEFVALGHAGSEHYAGLETFPNPGVSRVEMTSDELAAICPVTGQAERTVMDERTEMRIHVGDNARTLRGVEQVGGWFLRADKGIKMIPGDVRDMGNTYQADLVVVRPGAPSQHLDAQFRVEAGKITSINLAPR